MKDKVSDDKCGRERGSPGTLAIQTDRAMASEEVFGLLVASIKDYAIFMLDPSGYVATWNAGAQRFKGYEADEIIGRHFSTFYPETDVASGKCEMELEVSEREGRFEEEGWRVRKDGTQFWANVVITAVRDASNTLVGFAKVTRDLTDRKRAEDERLAVEQRFRLLVESVKDYALIIMDPRGYISTWNEGAERIKGYKADEIIGRHFSTFYPSEDVAAAKCELELQVAEREGNFEEEGWRVRKDGTTFWANVVISAMRDQHGTLVGFSKVTRDLTERRRGDDERAARRMAEQANKSKDEFLAMLGHELRNPMAPIVTALELLKLRGERRGAKEHQVIERQVKHMMHLIDDLLDVSRIARGKIDIKRKQVDVRDVMAKAVEIASPLFEERRHHVDITLPPHDLVVSGDEARLTQVLGNLLTNASKYTDPGGHISASAEQEGEQIVIEVCDDGRGITEELLPRVFDLFEQGYQSSDRSGGGLGLGLTVVRSLVEVHGGTVQAHSDGVGKGSRFVIRLPAVSEPVAEEPDTLRNAALPRANQPQKILLVDDNEDARMLLEEILSSVGHQVVAAGDGAEALEAIKTFAPDVAILDIGLPVMDGYELAGRVRQIVAHVRLIALTGYGQRSDRERTSEAGFEKHLVKPIDVRTVLAAVSAPD